MEKQTIRSPNVSPEPDRSARPPWWNDTHASRWDRVKEAIRRDWEQTKADFSKTGGAELNQNIGDTLKQAVGAAPLPPPSMKTHPDDPRDTAKRVEKEIKERGKVQEKVATAQTDVAVERVRAQGAVASEQQNAQVKVVEEQRKLVEIAADAREAAAKTQRETQEKLAKQQERIADVRADASEKIAQVQQKSGEKIAEVQQRFGEKVAEAEDWNRIEAAVRYGYGARLQYADVPEWNDALEERLRLEWGQLRGAGAWDEMRVHVRRGWDSAMRSSLV